MATQTMAVPDDHQGAGNLDLVRQIAHASAEQLQPRAKLRTNNSPSEPIHDCVHDSGKIIGTCATDAVSGRRPHMGANALMLWFGDFPTFGENSPSPIRISDLFSSWYVGYRFASIAVCLGSCGARMGKWFSRLSVE
jgi:hypothetical protein